MRFGLFFLSTYFPEYGTTGQHMRRLVDVAALGEELGFDSVWANEHHFHPYGGHIPSVPIFLTGVAQRTKRMRLGSSVIVLPLHNPIEIAEQIAMLDLMSGGRVDVCFGRGNVGVDFTVFGIDRDEGQERTLEGLDVLLKAWTGQPFSHEGRFFRYENLTVWPKPEQDPHPPVWFPCSQNPESFAYAGRQGYGLLTVAQHRPVEELADRVQVYVDARRAAGHDLESAEVATHYQVFCHEDGDRAREIAGRARDRYDELSAAARGQAAAATAGIPIQTMIDQGRVIVGTPDECIQQFQRGQDVLGLTAVDCNILFGGMTYEESERSMRLLAREVLPALHDRQPSWRGAPVTA
ncbi:MAG TPA: LLM class flavin-dependent oxidoreductase [Chloroflexota bacterium]|nr:LLM class flavin-dependent oxidoreductase [Chloroflexota bacterium]